MNKLRLMSLFVHIVESGSITKASEKLDLSKSVLSSALKQLEYELDTCLLKRTTRKQSLTPAGERFYMQCAQMTKLAESAWLEAAELKRVPTGNINVTASHALMHSIVLPALTEVFADYPDVKLNLISDDKHVDIVERNVDLAIRVGTSGDSNLKQRKVGEFYDVLCCSSSFEEDWKTASYIAHDWQVEPIVHRTSIGEDHTAIKFEVGHKANTVFGVMSLLEMGLGVGIIPEFMLENNQCLQAVSNVDRSKPCPIYVLHPYHAHVPMTVTMAIKAIESRTKQVLIDKIER
ncbi:LysR family transcriptional regulator [Vibrio sagamiensis]|uniref:Transcriptional regulator n=1 Tax=Vibrio sagamiensis NBRC 104589 TaxID=1219064 RepID=A0A511QIA1_9VIBR|nr:LysR family transcriptional regulator [Vibrio sagamiensis]PNQ54023.1 LysR family transcriptional regulator [Vibrio agarivorans]GEM76182.1 transcriptional regulator [Vibrio sagamiensis NBRC 104589]